MTKNNPRLLAEKRVVFGKKVKQLRNQGLIPATVYGRGMESISVQFNAKDFQKIFSHVGESGLIDLDINGEILPILLRNPQYHPVEDSLVHIDCYKVNLKEKIIATVPITLIGESPAVKAGNVLIEVSNEVEVEALPGDLPETIEVDISSLLEPHTAILVSDLKVSEKVEIKTLPDQVIVKIEEPKVEEEPVVEETVPIDVPATAQKAPEEGEESPSEDKDKKDN